MEAEEVWAQDAARITLRPVTAEAARGFLAGRTASPGRWQLVLDAIARHPGGPLASALSTPWRLTVAATVYDRRRPDGTWDRYPAELLDSPLDTMERIRDHLLGLLIPTATTPPAAPDESGTVPAGYTPDRVRAWLVVLAVYLHTNTVTGRAVAGRQLPGTDLVLHELWPLARNRPRTLETMLSVMLLLAALGLIVSIDVLSPEERVPLVAVISVAALVAAVGGRQAWPKPRRLDWAALRTRQGIRVLAVSAATGAAVFAAVGAVVGVVFGTVFETSSGVVTSVVIWAVALAVFGSAFGAVFGVIGGGEAVLSGVTPRGVIRGDTALAFAVAFVFTFVFVLVFAAADGVAIGDMFAPVVAYVAPFAFAVVAVCSSATLSFVVFLLVTRRWWSPDLWLPWRLGRFLDWCCGVGLMRTAGVAYQFRHRELQEFLVCTAAVSVSGAASASSEGDGGRGVPSQRAAESSEPRQLSEDGELGSGSTG